MLKCWSGRVHSIHHISLILCVVIKIARTPFFLLLGAGIIMYSRRLICFPCTLCRSGRGDCRRKKRVRAGSRFQKRSSGAAGLSGPSGRQGQFFTSLESRPGYSQSRYTERRCQVYIIIAIDLHFYNIFLCCSVRCWFNFTFFSPPVLMNRRDLTQRQDGTKRSGRRQLAPHGPGEFTRFGNLHLFSRQPIRGRRFRSRHTRWEIIIRIVNIQTLFIRPLIKKCDTVSKEWFRTNWNSIPFFPVVFDDQVNNRRPFKSWREWQSGTAAFGSFSWWLVMLYSIEKNRFIHLNCFCVLIWVPLGYFTLYIVLPILCTYKKAIKIL